MNKIESVIFDLDGTLWDTCSSCAIGWNRVLSRNGISFRSITADDVRKVAGKTHEQCIREVFAGYGFGFTTNYEHKFPNFPELLKGILDHV